MFVQIFFNYILVEFCQIFTYIYIFAKFFLGAKLIVIVGYHRKLIQTL